LSKGGGKARPETGEVELTQTEIQTEDSKGSKLAEYLVTEDFAQELGP
jgi:hypothetical protein